MRPARDPLPDLIRVWALVGIALINVGIFASPSRESLLDQAAIGVVNTLFLSKSYVLFSIIFGASFAYQLEAAARARQPLSPRHFRRLTALFAIGAAHAVFLFSGDILMLYAVAGVLLFSVRRAPSSFLLSLGIACILAQLAVYLAYAGGTFAIQSDPVRLADYLERLEHQNTQTLDIFTQGTFWQLAEFRFAQLPKTIAYIPAQMLNVFGCFLIGLYLAREGYLANPAARLWRRSRQIALPVGLAGSASATLLFYKAAFAQSGMDWLATTLYTLFAPLTALGFAGLIAWYAATPITQFRSFISRAGCASLSVYILQSIAFSLIFSGYGLGQFGALNTSQTLLTGLGVGIASIILVGLWRGKFDNGPLEIMLRRWTYWQ